MNALIEEKQELFNDLHIPWDKSIEEKFATHLRQCPNADPEIVLDNIAKTYIQNALEHPTETYVAFLKVKYNNRGIRRHLLKREIGEELFNEFLANGTIQQVGKTQSYRVKG